MRISSKKIVSHILVAFVVLSCAFAFHTNAYAQGTIIASGQYGENVTWTLDSDGVMTISGTGAMWDAVGDSDIYDYHPCPWTDYRDSIKKVVFSEGITYVGAMAFRECRNLETIEFASTITSIGNYAFYYCTKLGNVDLPQNLQHIGQEAFAATKNMTSFIVPDSVTFIDAGVCRFNENLTYVYIGGKMDVSVYIMGGMPFEYCTSLEAIHVSENNFGLKSVDGVLYSKDGMHLVQYPLGKKDTSYTVLSTTEVIFQSAFEAAVYLENINIPEGVQDIGIMAFAEMPELKSLTIPSTVVSIGPCIVESCPKIEWVRNNSNAEINFGSEVWYDAYGNPISTLGNGIAYKQAAKNGLIFNEELGIWEYYKDDVIDYDYAGLAQASDGYWYYVENGILNWDYTGLVLYNGAWFYVENGALNWNYTGLTCYNGTWFYVEGGVLNWGYTGTVFYNGTWWYVENGIVVGSA